ncbi:ABC transporter ATP-binding protein [Natronolimnobius sp. AArcel1]|uniref:ABC transporter ATP-binding protein n=1 Tax=Natronolimnobius sp. AArcel1 TaxID=1679093 RepID=UPI0013EBE46B|nr:ABC transporter ATP-binding protein [Natronolimnobius sp. AArcel1]NGM68128.1 ABC transporter ATP-binding protein [Natronolimnobius sp. AArcel1]
MSAIALRNVQKHFGSIDALRGIDLEVDSGEVFGFLGPNGAGKSTTIDILLHYTRPSSGSVEVLDQDVTTDPVAVRERTGILPEGFAAFETMTGRQHLEYAIESNGADDDPDVLLERVGLEGVGDRLAQDYSKGMTQRLALAMALVGEPDLLILDEPSTGLDPHGVRRMREIVRAERDRGATVFFSSHILEQVEAVADRVGILRAGELVAVDTIDGLRGAVDADAELTVDIAEDPTDLAPEIDSLEGVSSVIKRDGELVVACTNEAKLSVLDEIRAAGGTVRDFTTGEASLEDLFVSYTEGSR